MSLLRLRPSPAARTSRWTISAALILLTLLATERPARADDTPRSLADRYAQPEPCRAFDGELPALEEYWYESYFLPKRVGEWASLGITVGLTIAGARLFASHDEEDIVHAGDVGQYLNPAVAAAVPLTRGDWRGLARFALAFGTSMAITDGLKSLVNKDRPDGSNDRSYPSWHTAASFSGAAFLYSNYGPSYGIPAYVVALYTAFSRVDTDRHFLDDVIAGAGIAMISNWLWNGRWSREFDPRLGRTLRPSWRIEFAFGTIWQTENDIHSPPDVGTVLDLSKIEGTDDQLATARFSLHWYPTPRLEFMFRMDPNELRGGETIEEEVTFGDATFAAGTDLYVRWMGTEYKMRACYELLPHVPRWSWRVGITAIIADYLVEYRNADTQKRIGVTRAIPAPHIQGTYALRPNLFALISADGVPGRDEFGIDVEAALRWKITPTWDVGLLLRWSLRPIGGDIDCDPQTQGVYIAVGRSL